MAAPTPAHCRPAAFQRFLAALDDLSHDRGLGLAAVAIATHELAWVDPDRVDDAIGELAETVRKRIRTRAVPAVLAHTHRLLFDELGFGSVRADYDDPDSSYLPLVLERRTGLPILLCLVYKLVLGRLGIRVDGVNAPGHFLASVGDGSGTLLVDAYRGGQVLSRREAAERVAAASRQPVDSAGVLLPRASHRDWVRRMLRNLHAVFAAAHRADDVAAVRELDELVRVTR